MALADFLDLLLVFGLLALGVPVAAWEEEVPLPRRAPDLRLLFEFLASAAIAETALAATGRWPTIGEELVSP